MPDASLFIDSVGVVLRVLAPDGHARSQRRLAPAALLQASWSTPLRHGHADGGDDGSGRGGFNADADGARDVPSFPRIAGRLLDSVRCAGGCGCGTCWSDGWQARAAGRSCGKADESPPHLCRTRTSDAFSLSEQRSSGYARRSGDGVRLRFERDRIGG